MGSWFLRVLAAIVLIPLFTLASAADEPEFATKLRPQIETKMQDWVTPGLMVLVDIPGKGTWIETFGTGDLASKAKPDPEGHTHIGSVTAIAGDTAHAMVPWPKDKPPIDVFADNQLEPNTNFILPADTIANVIVKELFP